MAGAKELGRRSFMTNAGLMTAGASVLLQGGGPAYAQEQALPLDLDPNSPIALAWRKQVSAVTTVNLDHDAPELKTEAVRERHRIYCLLLMALIRRFWNGNNKGP